MSFADVDFVLFLELLHCLLAFFLFGKHNFVVVGFVVHGITHNDFFLVGGKHSHVQSQRLQFLDKHFEGFGNSRVGNVFALDDAFVGLYTSHHVVGFDGKDFLQHVCRSVRFQSPHFHFAETLSAELSLAAQRLLRYQAVRTGASCVNLVVYQVNEFQVVHVTDGNSVFKRFARSAVVQLYFAVHFARFGVDHAVFFKQFLYFRFRCAVKHGGSDFPSQNFGDESQVYFQNLTDVHTGRYAQGVEHYLQRSTVFHEGHVFFRQHTGNDTLVTVTACHLVADGNFTFLRNVHTHQLAYAGVKFVLVFTGEHLYVHHDTAFAVGNTQRGVSHFSCLFVENGTKQSFFRREVRFSLGGNLTYKDVAGTHFRTYADYAVFVQILQCVFTDIGDISCKFFGAEFGFTALDFMFFDVNGGKSVLLHEFFRKQYCVFVVVAFPRHKADENVSAQRKFAAVGAGTVGKNLTFGNPVALFHNDFLVDAGSLVGAHKLFQSVRLQRSVVVLHDDFVVRRFKYYAVVGGKNHHTAVVGDSRFYARCHNGRLRLNERHCLTLHVTAHQRTVGVVVFQEGNKTCCNGNKLTGRNVDVVHLFTGEFQNLFTATAGNTGIDKVVVFVQRFVCLSDDVLVFFVGGEIFHKIRNGVVNFVHSAVGCFDKTIFVYAGVACQRGDKTDVLSFGRFNGAHSAVVCVVNVTHFECGSFSVKTAGAQCRKFTFVRKFRNGVGLVHELRKLRRTEKFLDCGRYGTHVDEQLRSGFAYFLHRHSFTDYPFQTGNTDTELILQQFAYGTDTTVAQMVDVVGATDVVLHVEVVVYRCNDVFTGDVLGHQLVLSLFDESRRFFDGKLVCKNFTQRFAVHRFHDAARLEVDVGKAFVVGNGKASCVHRAVADNLDFRAGFRKRNDARSFAHVHVVTVFHGNLHRFVYGNFTLAFLVGCLGQFRKHSSAGVYFVAVDVDSSFARHQHATQVLGKHFTVVVRSGALSVKQQGVRFLIGVNKVDATVLNVVGVRLGQFRACSNGTSDRHCNVGVEVATRCLLYKVGVRNVEGNRCAVVVQNFDFFYNAAVFDLFGSLVGELSVLGQSGEFNLHVFPQSEPCNTCRQSQLLVELVTSDFCQIVTLGVKQQIVQRLLHRFVGGDFARTQTLVDFHQRFLVRCRVVLGKRQGQNGIVFQQPCNKVAAAVVFVDTVVQNATQQHRYGQLSVAVNVYVQQIVVGIVFDFQPCATAGHCRCVVGGLAVFVEFHRAIHAGRTHNLRNDYTFRTVYDETSRVRHEGEIAHKHFLIQKFARCLVGKTHVQTQRTCIRCVTQTALRLAVLGMRIEMVIQKFQAEVSRHVLDGGKVFENFPYSLVKKHLITVLLHLYQVGQRQHFGGF